MTPPLLAHRWRRPALAAAVVLAVALGAAWWSRFHLTKQERVDTLDPAQVTVIRTPGGLLEVATLAKVEEFGWRTTWECPVVDCSRLPSTVSRIRVRAHYVYRVPLAAEWRLEPQGDHYRLQVPALQLQEPVGFETSTMEIFTTERSVFAPTAAPNRENAVRHLGPELARRGVSDAYVDAQRAAAAQTVREFAAKWMQEQGRKLTRPVEVTFTAPNPL
jgi:hypothetical protein